MLGAAAADPNVWPVLENFAKHAEAHVAAAEMAGLSAQVAELKNFVTSLRSSLQQLQEHEQQVQQELAATGQAPGQAAPQDPAAPPAALAPAGPTPPPGFTMEQWGRDLTSIYGKGPDEVKRQIEAILGLQPPASPTPTAPAPRPDAATE